MMKRSIQGPSYRILLPIFILFGCVLLSCGDNKTDISSSSDPELIEQYFPSDASSETERLTSEQVMQKAHEHAGGEFWKRPQSLSLIGYGYFYGSGKKVKHEVHKMYRVFEDTKSEAHAANGKVRIESYRDGQPIILVTFDGSNTYDLNGKRAQSDADAQWASNFGYGVIRHALDPGYTLKRLPDDSVDGIPSYQIQVIDPTGGETIFGIAMNDYKIIKVGFDTPRGWHERVYSHFFTKKEYAWQQSGLVRLYYNGIKSNEIIWTDFDVNLPIPDSLFIL